MSSAGAPGSTPGCSALQPCMFRHCGDLLKDLSLEGLLVFLRVDRDSPNSAHNYGKRSWAQPQASHRLHYRRRNGLLALWFASLRLQARIWFWGRWALRFRRRCGVQHSEVEAWLLGSKTLRPIVGFFFLCVLINSHCAVVLRRERVFSPCLRSTGSTANSIPSHPALVQSRSPSSLRCSAAAT